MSYGIFSKRARIRCKRVSCITNSEKNNARTWCWNSEETDVMENDAGNEVTAWCTVGNEAKHKMAVKSNPLEPLKRIVPTNKCVMIKSNNVLSQ